MNAFKRRRNMKNSVSTGNLPETGDNNETNIKPTFESIVQRVMRMRMNEGVKAEDESPPDALPIKGAVLKLSATNHNRSPTHERRSRSQQRRVFC